MAKKGSDLRSICTILVLLDLCALTWYCWEIPAQQFESWQKIITTAGGWGGSILGFFGLKKVAIEKLVDHWTGLLLVGILTGGIWLFVLPFHGLTLEVQDSISKIPIQKVSAKLDGAKGEAPGESDANGQIYLRGLIASVHEISLEKTGYKARLVTARFGDVLAIRDLGAVTLEKEEGRVNLITKPPGASIYLDGSPESIGPSPKVFPLSAGKHNIALKIARYFDANETVTVSPGEELKVDRDLRLRPSPPPPTFELLVSTSPDGAEVYVDGGRTPVGRGLTRLHLPAGKHHVTARLRGYVATEQEVGIPTQTILAFTLAPAEAHK